MAVDYKQCELIYRVTTLRRSGNTLGSEATADTARLGRPRQTKEKRPSSLLYILHCCRHWANADWLPTAAKLAAKSANTSVIFVVIANMHGGNSQSESLYMWFASINNRIKDRAIL